MGNYNNQGTTEHNILWLLSKVNSSVNRAQARWEPRSQRVEGKGVIGTRSFLVPVILHQYSKSISLAFMIMNTPSLVQKTVHVSLHRKSLSNRFAGEVGLSKKACLSVMTPSVAEMESVM